MPIIPCASRKWGCYLITHFEKSKLSYLKSNAPQILWVDSPMSVFSFKIGFTQLGFLRLRYGPHIGHYL